MGSALDYDIATQALQVLFLVGLPVVFVLSLVGMVVAVLQATTALHDNVLPYAVKLLCFILLIYFLFPTASRSLVALAELSFR